MDGVAKGIDTLKAILGKVQEKLRPISFAVFDLQKAFDIVSHSAINKHIKKLEIPIGITEHLKYIYKNTRKFQ